MNSKSWLWAAVGAVVIIAGSFAYFNYSKAPADADPEPAVEAVPAAPNEESGLSRDDTTNVPFEPEISVVKEPEQKVDESDPMAAPEPLPALEESDAAVLEDARVIFGDSGIPAFLIPETLIEHFVVTVENLDQQPIRLTLRPVRHVAGAPVVKKTGSETVKYLDAANAERYASFIRFLLSVEPVALSRLFDRYEPLFQQAYREMGYPKARFRDRLLEVIDHLLETPEVQFPIPVVQPKVFYQFADPALEERSWGQKAIIRTGPQNSSVIKAFLRRLHTELR